jgi:hypothetical protein
VERVKSVKKPAKKREKSQQASEKVDWSKKIREALTGEAKKNALTILKILPITWRSNGDIELEETGRSLSANIRDFMLYTQLEDQPKPPATPALYALLTESNIPLRLVGNPRVKSAIERLRKQHSDIVTPQLRKRRRRTRTRTSSDSSVETSSPDGATAAGSLDLKKAKAHRESDTPERARVSSPRAKRKLNFSWINL